uniref:PU-F1 n=1 Tax=Pinctada fucata TaxID=50426 RepID=A0A0P0L368_PINFU|nr:PU-F1 [Pinctada fucata]
MPTPKKVAEHFGRQFVRPDPQYPRDIIVIIDSSGSIGNELFNRALRDLAELVGYFCPEPDPFVPQNNSFYHRLGVIQFSTETEDIFNLDRYDNLGAIQGAIRSIKYMQEYTCTEKAFDAAYRMITQNGGARPPAVAKKQVLILTDGMWNCDGDPVAASKRLQTVADVYGFMIGINSKAGRRKLEKVISEPLLNHLFAVKDFSKFNVVVRQLRTTIKRGRLQCKEFQKP